MKLTQLNEAADDRFVDCASVKFYISRLERNMQDDV